MLWKERQTKEKTGWKTEIHKRAIGGRKRKVNEKRRRRMNDGMRRLLRCRKTHLSTELYTCPSTLEVRIACLPAYATYAAYEAGL